MTNGKITIRQNFRLNDEDYYTIFDVPIDVTNLIEASDERRPCDDMDNALLSPEEIDAEAANDVGILFAPGDATEIDFDDLDDDEGDDDNDDDGEENVDQDDDEDDGANENDGDDDGVAD